MMEKEKIEKAFDKALKEAEKLQGGGKGIYGFSSCR